MDIYGRALTDFYNRTEETLWINNSYGEPEEMPIDVFFRTEDEMPELESIALQHCRGKILDIGAGVGSHTLILQKRKMQVSAIEISKAACQIMEKRGVKQVINEDIFKFSSEKFDTLLLLMNGIGLSGTLNGLIHFLQHAQTLLAEGGQLIFDSSDISYLYEDGAVKPEGYFGEISFQYEYAGIKGNWFKWLYVDKEHLSAIAKKEGWDTEILFEDDNDQYLAKLTRSQRSL